MLCVAVVEDQVSLEDGAQVLDLLEVAAPGAHLGRLLLDGLQLLLQRAGALHHRRPAGRGTGTVTH